jgi:acyl carrier protein
MNAPVGHAEIGGTSRARSPIALVSDLVREHRGQGGRALAVSLCSRRDRDLGIDSLGRTELVLRIERMFRIRLPVNIMDEADTVGDILIALEQGSPDARTGIAVEAQVLV